MRRLSVDVLTGRSALGAAPCGGAFVHPKRGAPSATFPSRTLNSLDPI